MKSKLRIVGLVMLIMLWNFSTFSLAANEQLTFSASKDVVKSGDTFEITIAQESDGIVGFESSLNYDTDLFTLTKVENGTGWRDMGNQTTKFDAISDTAIKSGNIFKLTFSVKEDVSVEESDIELTGIKLYRTSTDMIQLDDKIITVEVEETDSPDDNEEDDKKELKGITLDNSNLTLVLGITKKMGLSVQANPLTASLPEIVWSSSNEKVVTIEKESNSMISLVPVGVGNATITAKTKDGEYTATCNVTVNASGDVSGDTNNTNTNNTNNNNKNDTNGNQNVVNDIRNISAVDNTTKSGILPKTGSVTRVVLLAIAGLLGVGVVSYISYKKYKGI